MWNGRLNSLLSRISPLLSPSQTPLENCSILENILPCSTSAARQGCERILAPPHRMVGRCRAEPSVHPAWEETTASALLFLGYGFPFLLYIILILQTPVIFFFVLISIHDDESYLHNFEIIQKSRLLNRHVT